MTVYQELQLSSAGSKNLIRRTENKEEKDAISLFIM